MGKKYNNWKKFVHKNFCDEQFKNIFFINFKIYKRLILYSIFIFFITLALVDTIQVSKKKNQHTKNIKVVFALDISNSMNAQDIIPSRLEKSKKIIENIVDNLQINKIGLIIFAGQAYTLVPITHDLNAFKLYLHSINSEIIDFQGTNINNAIKESISLFKNYNKEKHLIILISDGEDNSNKENLTIKLSKKYHIQIISIGIGTKEGSSIPIVSNTQQQMKYLTDKYGNIVITKLVEEKLKKISKKTFGIYINSNLYPNYKILKKINNILISIQNNNLKQNNENKIQNHYFQYYLGLSLLTFFIILITNFNNELNI